MIQDLICFQKKLFSKPLSLCKWMFCLPNFLVRKSRRYKRTNLQDSVPSNYPWSHQIQDFFSYIVFITSESLPRILYCFYQFFFNDCHRLSIFNGFCYQFCGYWWAEFYKRVFAIIFDCLKPLHNWYGVLPLVHWVFFSDFNVNKFKIVFDKYFPFLTRLG